MGYEGVTGLSCVAEEAEVIMSELRSRFGIPGRVLRSDPEAVEMYLYGAVRQYDKLRDNEEV